MDDEIEGDGQGPSNRTYLHMDVPLSKERVWQEPETIVIVLQIPEQAPACETMTLTIVEEQVGEAVADEDVVDGMSTDDEDDDVTDSETEADEDVVETTSDDEDEAAVETTSDDEDEAAVKDSDADGEAVVDDSDADATAEVVEDTTADDEV
ncbi:hypothetical protein ACN47E_009662 [Coniothyrium glycines]